MPTLIKFKPGCNRDPNSHFFKPVRKTPKKPPKPPKAKKPKRKRKRMTKARFLRMLKRHGWHSYTHYRRSSVWKRIRAEVLERDEHQCCFCKRKAIQVHHAEYSEDAILGKCLNGLFSVCRGCHYRLEFKPGGKKVDTPKVAKATWKWNKWGNWISKQHAALDREFDAIVGQ